MSNLSTGNFVKNIERMEDLVLTGMGVPLTPWCVVNADKLVPLLDKIRESLPDEIQHSQLILQQREQIVTEAQQKAQQMLHDARLQAEQMLSDSELLRAVHTEAERIRQQFMSEMEAIRRKTFEETEAMKARAYEESRNTREGADQYAEVILNSLDKSLAEFHGVVRNGQKYLKRAKVEALSQQQGPQQQQAPQADARLYDLPPTLGAPQQQYPQHHQQQASEHFPQTLGV